MITLSAIVFFLYLKAKQAPSAAAAASSAAASAVSGVAPSNGMLASPGMLSTGGVALATPVTSDDDSEDGDAGGMNWTLSETSQASGDSPGVCDFDQNETQASSGSDTAATGLWRPPVAGRRWNHVLMDIWEECWDVDYLSPSPSVQFQFAPPPMLRQDNNPYFNNQPWAGNLGFQGTDPTRYFETDDSGVPLATDDEEDV